MRGSLDRRTLLRSAGSIAAVGLFAGCSGGEGDGDSGESGGGGDSDGEDTETTATETATATEGSSDSGAGEAVASYLSSTENFDGSVADQTGQNTVTVTVGAEGNGGAFAYGPAAISVSTGTTVEFDWTGNGGTHNVVSEGEGPLDSGGAVDASGVQYEYTFEEAGTYLYYCLPHESLGMKGAIVVE